MANYPTIQAFSQVVSCDSYFGRSNKLRTSFGMPIRGGQASPLRVATGEKVAVKRIGISSLPPPGVMEEALQVGGTAYTQWICYSGQRHGVCALYFKRHCQLAFIALGTSGQDRRSPFQRLQPCEYQPFRRSFPSFLYYC